MSPVPVDSYFNTPGQDGDQLIEFPWAAWSGGSESRSFPFPGSWDVKRLDLTGWPEGVTPDYPAVHEAVRLGAAGRSSACIAIEDLTRPARLAPVLEAVVSGLTDAGLDLSKVEIVVAVGTHRAPTWEEIRLKIGGAIADVLRVRIHDTAGDLAPVGLSVGGCPLLIDRLFIEADYRIGVGSVVPNPFAGFSGGGKLVFPGLTSVEAAAWLHKLGLMGFGGGPGILGGNRIRTEIDKVATALPLHLSLGCLVDSTRTIREIFVGEPVAAHRHACRRATVAYSTPMSGRFDILFCNAYPKDGEFLQSENAYTPLRTGGHRFLSPNGSVVLMSACTHGRGCHGLFDTGQPLHRHPKGPKSFLSDASALIYSPGITEDDCRVTHWDGYGFYSSWERLIDALLSRYGASAGVGVFPAAALQLGPSDAGRAS